MVPLGPGYVAVPLNLSTIVFKKGSGPDAQLPPCSKALLCVPSVLFLLRSKGCDAGCREREIPLSVKNL